MAGRRVSFNEDVVENQTQGVLMEASCHHDGSAGRCTRINKIITRSTVVRNRG